MTKAIQPGELALRLEQSIVPLTAEHVADCPDLGPECANAVKPVPYRHHVNQLIAETVLDASLGITPWFAIDTRWSMRITDVRPRYSELDGTPKEVPNDIHHHRETLVDVTDPWLLARFAAVKGPFLTVARFGASFPVGRTVPDPYQLGQQGASHEHVQSGTGTVVPIVGFGAAYTRGMFTGALGGIGFFNFYENAKGFRAPARLYGTGRVALAFLERTLLPFVEVTFAHEREEYWHGLPPLEGSNVRSEVYLGGGVGWRFYKSWTIEAIARGRVASLTEAPTFRQAGVFSLALSTSFDLWGKRPGPQIEERRHDGVVEYIKK
jgi:hypothetical protein